MNMEAYLNELKGQIRDRYAKEFVADEMRGHIEDQAEAYERNGMSHEEALSKAVKEMGDPVEVGVELDGIHRPRMEWRFLLYMLFIAALNIGVQYVINRNMPVETGTGIFENIARVSIFRTIVGLAVMLCVYRLDYTFLVGRSRRIGLIYLTLITAADLFFGQSVNGLTRNISIGALVVPAFALMVLYLPIFAGILYEYRGESSASVKLALWMIAPVFIQLIVGNISFSAALFLMAAEAWLFFIARKKDWFTVDRKAVLLGGAGMVLLLIDGALVRLATGGAIGYVNSGLGDVFAKSNLLGGSDAAVAIMREIPSYRSSYLILGAVSANCGIVGMIGIIFSLTVLSVYMFHISLRQKNSLGYIVGCSCGVAISLQSLCNLLTVFCALPLNDLLLPLFASGLSFTIVDYVLLGLVLSIYRYKDIRREKAVIRGTLRRVE